MAKRLLFLFYSAIALFCIGAYFHRIIEFQQDLGRHLLLGRIIWQTRQVPGINLFSYTNYGFQFINTHWLSEVFFYLISLSSVSSLVWLKAITMALAVLLTVYTTLRQSKNLLATAASFVALSPLLLERTEIRPEIFTYLFTGIFLYVILGSVSDSRISKWLWTLPVLEILWVNIHIYFILGPILVFFLFLCQRTRKCFFLLALVGGATLINPHFLSGALYPFHVFDNYGYTIVENQNIFFLESLGVFNPNIVYFKIGLIVFLGSFFLTDWRKISIINLLLSTLIVLPLMNIRSFPLTFFLLLPALSQNLSQPNKFFLLILLKYKYLCQIVLIALISLIIFRSFRLISNDYYLSIDSDKRFGASIDERGKGAANFFLKNNLPGPIFNNFDIGGYLDYRLYPKYQVFIDNRPEAFPAKFIQGEYIPMQQSGENFDTVDKIYNFNTIIFAHTDGTPWGENFLRMISRHPDWTMVYLDDYAIIYSKRGATALSPLAPSIPAETNLPYLSYLSLGHFFSLIGSDSLAIQCFQKAFGLNPDSPLTNQAMSIVYSGNPNTAFLAEKYQKYYQDHTGLPLF